MVVMMLMLVLIMVVLCCIDMYWWWCWWRWWSHIRTRPVSCLCSLLDPVGTISISPPGAGNPLQLIWRSAGGGTRVGGRQGWRVSHGFPWFQVLQEKDKEFQSRLHSFSWLGCRQYCYVHFLGTGDHWFFWNLFNISATDILLSIATGYARTPWQFLCIEDLHGWQGWDSGVGVH